MIDIGVNLTSSQFNADADVVLNRGFAEGLSHMVLTGTSLANSITSGLAARRRPGKLFFTAGVHPHNASSWSDTEHDLLAELWLDEQCVAVGECGLDYYRGLSPKGAQRAAFEAQLAAAIAYDLPAFLHCRGAFDEFYDIVTAFAAQGGRGIVHCFTGCADEALKLQALGLHIGITGWVTETERGVALREAVKVIDSDKLHLETDAPYLIPRNQPGFARGRHRNEPANLKWVAEAVAQLRGVPVSVLQEQTAANSRNLFQF